MSAFGDLLTALIPFGSFVDARAKDHIAARAVLRKHAPCESCKGVGRVGSAYLREDCAPCSGEGWTPASVEAAIKREEERARVAAAVGEAAKDVVLVRDALDKRRKAEPNPDNREPSVPFEVDAAIDYLADVLAGNASASTSTALQPTCSECDGEGVVEVDTCALCDQGISRTCPQCGGA